MGTYMDHIGTTSNHAIGHNICKDIAEELVATKVELQLKECDDEILAEEQYQIYIVPHEQSMVHQHHTMIEISIRLEKTFS